MVKEIFILVGTPSYDELLMMLMLADTSCLHSRKDYNLDQCTLSDAGKNLDRMKNAFENILKSGIDRVIVDDSGVSFRPILRYYLNMANKYDYSLEFFRFNDENPTFEKTLATIDTPIVD